MKELSQTQLELLKSPLPAEAIKQHPTKTYLSSIKAIYVTERMNDVFGVGQWHTKVRKEELIQGGMVVVHVTFEVPEYGIYYECYGGNDNGGENSKNFDLGDAFKGATTDAITKIGSYLGIGIDVFKGKSTTPPAKKEETPPQEEKKEWLNIGTPAFEKAKAAIKAGTHTIADVRKKYAVSKKTEEVLNAH